MPAQSQSVYIVRLFLKNGSVVNYNFLDAGRAVGAKDLVARAMLEARGAPKPPRTAANPHGEPWVPPAICQFIDDASREAHWDGGDISSVQLHDMLEEIKMDVRMAVIGDAYRREMLSLAGVQPNGGLQPGAERGREPHVNEPYEPDPAPRTPSIARFAS